MNYNFLPESEQNSLRREYRIRGLIILLFFVSVSFVIGIGSLFPAYIYASLEEKIHLKQVAELQKTSDDKTIISVQKQLSLSSSLLNSINTNISGDVYSKTVNSIVSIRGNIKLTSFALEHPSTSTVTVNISGIAPTRSDLLSFKGRLQNLSPKTSVDLPLSTLAQDSKISFSIQVNEKLP